MAELSGFEVLGLLKEIGEALRGTYVNNIYRIGGSQLLRLRKAETEDVWLVVSPKKGVWPSGRVNDRTETSDFTTKLRGELERARFAGARQADLDRIFELDFEGAQRRTLIVELMPPGNIIVTDGEGRVVLALTEVRTQGRRVVKGAAYTLPRQTRASPLEVDSDDVKSMLTLEKTAGSAIGRHVALPRKYVSECLARMGVADGTPSAELEGREPEVVSVLAGMVAEARDRPKPCICETPRGDDLFVVPPRGLRVKDTAARLSELCDRLLLDDAQAEPAAESPAEVKRKETEVTVARLRAEAASLRSSASEARAAAGRARVSPMAEALETMKGSGVKPPREPTSPSAVASAMFDHAKNLEAKAAAAEESADRLQKRAARGAVAERPMRRALPRRRQEWYERFRWFFTSGGKLAIGGRDAQTNSALVTKHLDGHDTVYHADLFGSPFFVLKGGEAQSEEEVKEAAQATVAFSSAWKTGLGAADAYWVKPEQVKTAAPSGEYLQRGSFAIAGRKNFVPKNLVEIAVGTDDAGRVISGPEESIKGRTLRYLVLRPQREKGSDTAKRVLKELGPSAGAAAQPGLDEVLRMLPTGGGKIVRRKSVQATG